MTKMNDVMCHQRDNYEKAPITRTTDERFPDNNQAPPYMIKHFIQATDHTQNPFLTAKDPKKATHLRGTK